MESELHCKSPNNIQIEITDMKHYIYISLTAQALVFWSCGDFLEQKPDQKLAVPTTFQDLQALMENSTYLHYAGPSEGEVSSDDYYLTPSDLANLGYETDRNMHLWNPSIEFVDKVETGWSSGYRTVYYCNSVLEGLNSSPLINEKSTYEWNSIAGQALFFRANAFYDMAQVWAPPFESEYANEVSGLPLRMEADFNKYVDRSTLKETYSRIIEDLSSAAGLLPISAISKWRPSKPGAYGLLARVYLSMRDYDNALTYADSCLSLYSNLMDYNALDLGINAPIPANNEEVISYRSMVTADPIRVTLAKMDTSLYSLYHENDLRRKAFFRFRTDGSLRFQGNYTGTTGFFSGIATDEILLIKAECLARKEKIKESITLMNRLMENRFLRIDGVSTWMPKELEDPSDVLNFILEERRKELVMRGIRWADIRRLNLENRQISIKRTVESQEYILSPGDPRFVLPIPADVVRLSDIQQNAR